MLGLIFSLLNDRLSLLNTVDWNFLLEFCLINRYDASFTKLIDSYFDTVTFLWSFHDIEEHTVYKHCFGSVISRSPVKTLDVSFSMVNRISVHWRNCLV